MIVQKDNINIEEFKKSFTKKFNNFCSKLPLLISYTVQPNGVVIYRNFDETDTENREKLFYFEFDYESEVKTNIFLIKKKLLPYMPIMKQKAVEEVEADSEQTNEKVSQGEISLDDVTPNGYKVEKTYIWRIEKALIDRDELFVRRLKDFTMHRFKLRMPIMTFLNKLIKQSVTAQEAWNIFNSKAEEKELNPEDEGEK